eukprot:28485_1
MSVWFHFMFSSAYQCSSVTIAFISKLFSDHLCSHCAKLRLHCFRPHSNLMLHNRKQNTNNMASQIPIRTFVYTGEGIIPKGVTHVKFAPGVINLHRSVFDDCRKSLRVVVLNEG